MLKDCATHPSKPNDELTMEGLRGLIAIMRKNGVRPMHVSDKFCVATWQIPCDLSNWTKIERSQA